MLISGWAFEWCMCIKLQKNIFHCTLKNAKNKLLLIKGTLFVKILDGKKEISVINLHVGFLVFREMSTSARHPRSGNISHQRWINRHFRWMDRQTDKCMGTGYCWLAVCLWQHRVFPGVLIAECTAAARSLSRHCHTCLHSCNHTQQMKQRERLRQKVDLVPECNHGAISHSLPSRKALHIAHWY